MGNGLDCIGNAEDFKSGCGGDIVVVTVVEKER